MITKERVWVVSNQTLRKVWAKDSVYLMEINSYLFLITCVTT